MRLLHRLLWGLMASLLLAGCGAQGIPTATSQAMPRLADLDALRSSSDVAPQVNGADYIASSGIPSVSPHPTQSTWAVVDGDLAVDGNAWAIWRITLTVGQLPQFIEVTLPSNGLRRYWIAYADFANERWQFLDTGADPLGQKGTPAHLEPANPSDLLSPALNMYVAVIVRGGQSPSSAINVGYLEATYTPASGTDPIFDDFEDNDALEDCYILPGAGMYHASIHETGQAEMYPEIYDRRDLYCLTVPAGKRLTVTLRHEPQNHFLADPPPVDYTDLDLWYLPASAANIGEVVEEKSSAEVFYGFEQIHLLGESDLILMILPDVTDQFEDNAEYDLGVFFSDSTHTVSGKVTQNGGNVDKRFCVFLEPGNFNVPTIFDSGSEGEFVIEGVPDGNYTLKVQGSAGFYQTGYIYSETIPVTVSGGNVPNSNINISAFPGP